MQVLWNIDKTECVPYSKISYLRVNQRYKDNVAIYEVLAFFPGNAGNFVAFTADNKERCIHFIECL